MFIKILRALNLYMDDVICHLAHIVQRTIVKFKQFCMTNVECFSHGRAVCEKGGHVYKDK